MQLDHQQSGQRFGHFVKILFTRINLSPKGTQNRCTTVLYTLDDALLFCSMKMSTLLKAKFTLLFMSAAISD